MKDFITYGIFICKEKFNSLQDDETWFWLNKPRKGGLWGSPVDSEWGWKDWCEGEEFNIGTLKTYTKWRLRNPNKILIIDSKEDFIQLMNKYGVYNENYSSYKIDFHKIKIDGYDGVMLTAKGYRECRHGIPFKGDYIDLCTWDCESIVVWNWNQIKIIEKGRLL